MRFESLILERFGMFEDATLDFATAAACTSSMVQRGRQVHRTRCDVRLLFGIDERTPFNFRFEYGQLRIGAKIANSNGERLEFKRRKARAGTLVSLSQPETTLPTPRSCLSSAGSTATNSILCSA